MSATPVIIQFDSEKYYVQVADLILFSVGLVVSNAAIGKQEAEQLLGKIQSGRVNPTLAIIDTMVQVNHTEGEKIATKLKQLKPEIKIIAYTLIDDEEIPWADAVAIKTLKDTNRTLRQCFQTLLGLDFSGTNQIDKS